MMPRDLPRSLSAETTNAFRKMIESLKDMPPLDLGEGSLADWDALAAQSIAMAMPMMDAIAARAGARISEDVIEAVPVVRIAPRQTLSQSRKILYAHGGGYTLMSARSTVGLPALLAEATGLEVISVDYTLAPRGTWRTATEQVGRVYRALLNKGIAAPDIVLGGDSAGGGLVLGTTLRLRDEKAPLPAGLFVASPWVDLTLSGDSGITLADSDFTLTIEPLRASAEAYAALEDRSNPYVSPVFADYSKPFPPTLIQAGTRELALSDAVRLYQAMRTAGQVAVLDVYEGMPHVHQTLLPEVEETRTAIGRAAEFLTSCLCRS